MDIYEKELLEKIDSGKRLNELEILEVLEEYQIDNIYGENRRWSRSVRTISEIGGRFFAIDWEEGLTECQDDAYYNQPVEVEKVTYEKTITATVTDWTPINRNKKRNESEE